MPLCNYYYLILLLFFYTKCLQAYPCHVCNTMFFNYSMTIDKLPSPTGADCQIITAETGCFTRIDWFNDESSQVLYGTNPGFPYDIVNVQTRRSVDLLAVSYSTVKYIAYVCGSSDSTPCNTVENLKRSIISTTLPTTEQIKQFDSLIVPATDFDSKSCLVLTNMTDNCPPTDPVNCQQCIIAVEYLQTPNICAACPENEVTGNLLVHDTTFFINNRTQYQEISLECQIQMNNGCNSIENVEAIRQTLKSKFDFDKFFYSTASTSKSTMTVLMITFFISLFRWI